MASGLPLFNVSNVMAQEGASKGLRSSAPGTAKEPSAIAPESGAGSSFASFFSQIAGSQSEKPQTSSQSNVLAEMSLSLQTADTALAELPPAADLIAVSWQVPTEINGTTVELATLAAPVVDTGSDLQGQDDEAAATLIAHFCVEGPTDSTEAALDNEDTTALVDMSGLFSDLVADEVNSVDESTGLSDASSVATDADLDTSALDDVAVEPTELVLALNPPPNRQPVASASATEALPGSSNTALKTAGATQATPFGYEPVSSDALKTAPTLQNTSSLQNATDPHLLATDASGVDLSETLGAESGSQELDSFERALENAMTKNALKQFQTISSATASGLSFAQTMAADSRTANASVPMSIANSVMSPNWGSDVTDKVLWMAAQGISEAEIQLDPPELGPLQARVTVHQDQAQVVFTSHSAQVRDVLDQTASRLREMFASEGLNLVDVGVSDHQSRDSQQQQKSGGEVADSDMQPTAVTQAISSQALSQFLVDQYV